MIRPSTIRIVITLALIYQWDIRQLDVNNTFLHNNLNKSVYIEQPPGFIHTTLLSYVYKLNKAL